MNNPLIIALDFESKKSTIDFLKSFSSEKLFVKVGMELFYQEGPSILESIRSMDHEVFLDLKLHDIPNTVKRVMNRLANLECKIVNVHAAGGRRMMEAAIEGLDAGTPPGKERPYCIAVTQLTSTSQEEMQSDQRIPLTLLDSVLHYSEIAKDSGLDGVVCSVFEASKIRREIGSNFLTVTPGIRLEKAANDDQNRIATPETALAEGVSAIVVGRPITRAQDPVTEYHKLLRMWKGELK